MLTDFTPVFIVGSARSGTTILSKLLSAHPSFCEYNAETLLLEVCRIKYGDIFHSEIKKEKFLYDWFRSRQFKRSNLTKKEFLDLFSCCDSYPALLIEFLRRMALKDGKRYIIDSTPSNIFSVSEIAKVCPEAIFLRIVRDGRDVAISQVKLGWSNPPWPFRKKSDFFHYSMVVWQYSQRIFERNEKVIKSKTIYFEDLIRMPDKVMNGVVDFIGIRELSSDYYEILRRHKNTAFGEDQESSPIERWKREDKYFLKDLIFNISETLHFHGYFCETGEVKFRLVIRYYYFCFFLRVKRLVSRNYYIGRHSSQELESEL